MENRQSKVVHAPAHWEGIGPTLLLAGPCSKETDWRKETIKELHAIGFRHGAILVPRRHRDWNLGEAEDFVWHEECLKKAHAVALWIPKECAFVGYTQSALFKKCLVHQNVIIGHQKHMRNAPALMRTRNVSVCHTLNEMLTHVAELAKRACVQAESAA